MLAEAKIPSENVAAAPTFGKPVNETHQSDGLLDSPTAIPDELDVCGSEFSWSSIGSGPSHSAAEGNASAPEVTSGFQAVLAPEIMPLSMPTVPDPSKSSAKRHSLYFWETITFKVSRQPCWGKPLTDMTQVEGVIFQLPKYRFVEGSDEFMAMVAGGVGPNEPIELDVALGDFETFLKAFLPR
jgi:hypothetical protein